MGSRWLGPSEVVEGPEMQLPWWGWPCQVAREFAGDGVRIDGHGPGRCSSFVKLGPGPLVAAPRWSGKPPRVLVVWPDKRDVSARWEHGPRPTQMVTKRASKVVK